MLIRYSRWDGSQAVPDLDADDLLSAMSDDLMLDGDPWRALRRLFQQGLQHPAGQRTPGLQDLLKQLRQQRQQRLDRYDLGGALEDIKKKLAEVIQTEREGIKDRLAGTSAEQKLAELDKLPPDPGGQIFPGAESLDELLAQLGRGIAQMQSLLESMSPGQRGELQDMMRSLFMQDERLEAALAQLAGHLEELLPLDELRRRYEFGGDEEVTLREAMKLMEELQGMDQLERQLRRAESPADLEQIDPAQVAELLGEEAVRDLEKLREIAKKLEEAGYLERRGDRLELTARAIRKIADKALRDIFAHLKRDRFGRHVVSHRGAGGDRTDDTKRYEFGDPFLLDLKETLMNAVERGGPGTPVRLVPDDFEVFRTELSTRAATVVMLDMSRSMINNGLFMPAKKVALALHALIRGQFPRDSLHIVGFSLYAREFTAEQLPSLTWTDWNVGTNMHAGFALSRQFLGRQKVGNKQIIMITDGEPTAHLEGDEAEFAYPPTRRTFQETLKEVQRCTRDGITINTFMLDRSPMLTAFVQEMARINRGRAFFAAPERLGEYVLVDYVRNKRRAVS